MGSETALFVPLSGLLLGFLLGLLATIEIGEQGDGGARRVALPQADLLALAEHDRLLSVAHEAHQPVLADLTDPLGEAIPALPEGGIALAPAVERGQGDARLLRRARHLSAGPEGAQEEDPDPCRRPAGGTGLARQGPRDGCDGRDGSRRGRRSGAAPTRRLTLGGRLRGRAPRGRRRLLAGLLATQEGLVRSLVPRLGFHDLRAQLGQAHMAVGRRQLGMRIVAHHGEDLASQLVIWL